MGGRLMAPLLSAPCVYPTPYCVNTRFGCATYQHH
uniref:Uncharacterized protein n=1 Tax=Anguilla anguilla TaxID=7936 RepID=A0A0E9XGE3_ANGAN